MSSRTIKAVFFFLLVTGYFLLVTSASAATLYFYPQNISLVPGEEALIDIRLNTDETVNAVELEGVVSGVVATLRGIDNAGSDLSIFVEKPNVKGKSGFRLVGGAPAGLSGELVLARLAVRGELPGKSTLSFTPDKTRVLLADGTGNSAAVEFMSAAISIVPRSKDYLIISSESHPDQNQWYAANTAQLRFSFDPAAAYSYVVTRNPLEDPDAVADKPEGSAVWDGGVKLGDLPEGVSYFAVRKIGSNSVSRYRMMTDVTDPAWVEVRRNDGTIETEGRPFLSFLAQDDYSGVEHYEMRINGGEPVTVNSPQPLPDEYTVLSIRAYDRAGNYIEEFIPGPQKDFSLWVWAAILFVLLVWVSGIIDTDKRKK
jgi:hypothetical protein